ncbi:hypothetical protein [Tahibacter harae]|uniref:Outer membrane repeat protein n=1 Tax=Tahibacter harae TaxID=2963937 RepID=A0ABT1QWS2_9GAMM|nr:hypothetical protein [Tahibacter harae]MCQ4166739.1 hypothetical protein [Tahibacter harae]
MKRCIALLTLLNLATPALALNIRVGADAGCDTNSLATALAQAKANPGADTIRVASNQAYTGQALYIDSDVVLRGGYANCDAATPSGRTSLAGNGSWAVITTWSENTTIDVRLEGLDISGGGVGGDIGNFGGIDIGGRSFVKLADLRVHDNVGIFGGGISVNNTQSIVTIEHHVEVDHNRASIGGGIAVFGGTLRVRPHEVVLHNNTASDGGGLFIDFGLVSVGSDPEATTYPVDGFLIRNNAAGSDGGGIYVNGNQGKLLAETIVVRDNSAAREGGGIYATNGGYAQFMRWTFSPGQHCTRNQECLRLSGNTAQRGGALALSAGATASLSHSLIRDNAAANGPALVMRGNSSQLRLLGSVVARNACTQAECAPILADGGGGVRANYTTFAGNTATMGGQPLVYAYGPIGVQGAMVFHSSLLSGNERFTAFGNSSYTSAGDCTLKETGVVEAGFTRSDIAPIRFADAARNNYRLAADNAAIDFCNAGAQPTEDPDIDGIARGLESPGAPNDFGAFDLGAYEYETLFNGGMEGPR